MEVDNEYIYVDLIDTAGQVRHEDSMTTYLSSQLFFHAHSSTSSSFLF